MQGTCQSGSDGLSARHWFAKTPQCLSPPWAPPQRSDGLTTRGEEAKLSHGHKNVEVDSRHRGGRSPGGGCLPRQSHLVPPWSLDLLYEKAFAQALFDEPELLSSLGLVEQFGITATTASSATNRRRTSNARSTGPAALCRTLQCRAS